MYARLAPYYDAIHAELTADVPFVCRWAQQHGAALLDLGCGAGRLLVPLAEAGLTVIGVDNEPVMLARARAAVAQAGLGERVHLEMADLTALALPDVQCDLALFSHNTLNHFAAAELEAALRATRRHVRPGGHLLIDIANPLALADLDDAPDWEEERRFPDPATGLPVIQFSRFFHDREAQQLRVEWAFETADGRRETAETLYHYEFPHLLVERLQAAGWQPQEWWGDYDGSPYDEDAERLIVSATAVEPTQVAAP